MVVLAVRGPEEKAQGFFLKNGLTLGLSCMVFKGTKVADLNKTEPPTSPVLLGAVESAEKHWKVQESTRKYWLRVHTYLVSGRLQTCV